MPNSIPKLIARLTALESIVAVILQESAALDPGMRKTLAARLSAMSSEMRARDDHDTAAYVDLLRDEFMENT